MTFHLVGKPRVLMAVPRYPYPILGGLERQSQLLCKSLVSQGLAEVIVLSGFVLDNRQHHEVLDGAHVYRVPWGDTGRRGSFTDAARLCCAMVDLRSRYDVVHLHNISLFGTVVTATACLLGKPVIVKLPNVGRFGIPGMREGLLGPVRIGALKHASAIVAMTEASLDELKLIGYPLNRVLKIANGVTSQALLTSKPTDLDSPVRIVFVGRLSPEKGLFDLLAAWPAVLARATAHVELHIYGAGPQQEMLRIAANAPELQNSVFCHGYLTNVAHALTEASIFVLPSYEEGNSNAILEAMSFGVPIVATNVGGTSILVGADGAALLVAPGDGQGLTDRLVSLIDDEPLRYSLGRAMQKRVREHFRIEDIATTYANAYQLLVQRQATEISSLSSSLF